MVLFCTAIAKSPSRGFVEGDALICELQFSSLVAAMVWVSFWLMVWVGGFFLFCFVWVVCLFVWTLPTKWGKPVRWPSPPSSPSHNTSCSLGEPAFYNKPAVFQIALVALLFAGSHRRSLLSSHRAPRGCNTLGRPTRSPTSSRVGGRCEGDPGAGCGVGLGRGCLPCLLPNRYPCLVAELWCAGTVGTSAARHQNQDGFAVKGCV